MAESRMNEEIDLGAAVTRSLLGWGVVAGVFYLAVGITQGLLRDGFSFADHPLSLLMLGDFGWVQKANLIATGSMVIAAAVGFRRAMRPGRRASRVGVALGIHGLALIGSGIFPPDPVDGFPDAGTTAEATTSGMMHLVFGGIGFVALATAAFFVAGWLRERDFGSRALFARMSSIVILAGFLGGAALATSSAGVALLWIAVVVGLVWLAVTSLWLYRAVPHPDSGDRASTAPA